MPFRGESIYQQPVVDRHGDVTEKLKNHAILGLQFPDIFPQLVVPESWDERVDDDLSVEFPVQEIDGYTWDAMDRRLRQQPISREEAQKQTEFRVAICQEAIRQSIRLAQHGIIIGDRNSTNWILQDDPDGNLEYGNERYTLTQVDLASAYDVETRQQTLDPDKWYPDQHIELENFPKVDLYGLFFNIKNILFHLHKYLLRISGRELSQREKNLVRKIDEIVKYGGAYLDQDANFLGEIVDQLGEKS